MGDAEGNVGYAVAAICAPYVLDGVDPASLPRGKLVMDDGWREFSGQDPGSQHLRVGFAGFVHAEIGTSNGNRQCDITTKHADPQAMRHAVLAALAKRPEGFVPTRSHYLPGHFATEDQLCTSAASAHPAATVLLSAAPPELRDRQSILFTLGDSATRMESCDHPGVHMNYRALAPDQQ